MVEEKLKGQLDWFIRLRWIAVLGVFAVLLLSRYIFEIRLPYGALYAGGAILLLYNIAFFFYNQKLRLQFITENWWKKANCFANTQISADLIMLVCFIHFAGGIENPFIFYFIFHMVIASILLSNTAAWLQTTLAVVLFGMVITGEHFQIIIPHYHLEGFIQEEYIFNRAYVFSTFAVFATTLYITVYMATRIVNRLRAREKEVTVANTRLEEQDRLKSQYVQRVSHDIQSSLATIQNCLKIILDGYTDAVSEKALEMISRAEKKTTHLLCFVKDLLNLSRIKATKDLEKSMISLKETVKRVVEQLSSEAQAKNISLQMELPDNLCVVNANSDNVEELLMNLLKNGIKYTAWKGMVSVHLKKVDGKEGCFHFKVRDTGIGIPAEELPKIFEEFYRSKDAENFVREGTGLGLSIVKEILKAHRAEIWVESCVGKGSSFFLHYPIGTTAIPVH